jgi:hypothetical protein
MDPDELEEGHGGASRPGSLHSHSFHHRITDCSSIGAIQNNALLLEGSNISVGELKKDVYHHYPIIITNKSDSR